MGLKEFFDKLNFDEYFEMGLDFLKENWIPVASICGTIIVIILLGLIISAAGRSRRRKKVQAFNPVEPKTPVMTDQEIKTETGSAPEMSLSDKAFFLEGEYDALLKSQAAARWQDDEPAAAVKQETPVATVKPEEPPVAAAKQEEAPETDTKLGDVQKELVKGPDTEPVKAETPADQEVPAVPDIEPIEVKKIEILRAAPARKFGAGNFNTARSGRVYTEEELQELIRK